MKRSIIIFSLLFLINLALLHGQESANIDLGKSVDSLVSYRIKPTEPGASILIARKGKVIYEKAFGSANLELNVPLQTDMVFRIGSVTKQFTAIGILQLVEQGKISLQDSIQKYVRDFPSKGYTITIENLLTHTSGIPDYSNADTVNPYIEREDFTPERIINYFKRLPLEFKPGTRYNYSNSGFLLLAYIIQKVTGVDYHQYMDENVIKRAGLTNTFYATENTIVPKRVNGYTRDRGFYENREYQTLSIGFGCGDLMSTVEDLFKWNESLLAYKLVRKETLEKAFTPFILADGKSTHYGYGWFVDSSQGQRCIHHEGQVSGFIAEEEYFPGPDTYVAILTNVKSGEDTTDFSERRFLLFSNVISLGLGKQLPKETQVNENILNSYIGHYAATFKKNSTLTVYRKDGQLYMDLSNGTGKNMVMLAQSATKFLLPDVKSIETTCEFISANGKITKLVFTQDKQYEWKKID